MTIDWVSLLLFSLSICVVGMMSDDKNAIDLLMPRGLRERTSRRCTARNRQGEQCGNPALSGQWVCGMHGGRSPLALAAARERLALALEPAIEIIHRALSIAPPCPHCGRSDSDKDYVVIKTALSVLDRNGLGPHAVIDVKQDTNSQWTQYLTDSELDTVSQMFAAAQERMASGHVMPWEERPHDSGQDLHIQRTDGNTIEHEGHHDD